MPLHETVSTYSPSAKTLELVDSTPLLLIAGVVGGGKNTVINELIKDSHYHLIVSHTTRQPRDNHGVKEINGVDYHFVTSAEIQKLVEDEAFVEIKEVHGNYYGTSASELGLAYAAGKTALTDVDIKGVIEYLNMKPNTHAIFLIPPSIETWLSRLERRYGDLEKHRDEIDTRFRTARDEVTHIMKDKRFILVVNDDLETTVDRINKVAKGEKDHTSDYAYSIAEHLLEYIDGRLGH